MSEEAMKSRAKQLIDEYLVVGDVDNVLAVWEDCGEQRDAFIGHTVSRILTKFVDVAKADKQKLLLQLLESDDAIPLLQSAQECVEEAVRTVQYLMELTDTLTDCPRAVDYLGAVVGCLRRIDVVRAEQLDAIVEANIVFNTEELMADPDITRKVYGQFLDIVNA